MFFDLYEMLASGPFLVGSYRSITALENARAMHNITNYVVVPV